MEKIKIEQCTLFQNRFCSVCKGKENVKELNINGTVVALCKKCRVKLSLALYIDEIGEKEIGGI